MSFWFGLLGLKTVEVLRCGGSRRRTNSSKSNSSRSCNCNSISSSSSSSGNSSISSSSSSSSSNSSNGTSINSSSNSSSSRNASSTISRHTPTRFWGELLILVHRVSSSPYIRFCRQFHILAEGILSMFDTKRSCEHSYWPKQFCHISSMFDPIYGFANMHSGQVSFVDIIKFCEHSYWQRRATKAYGDQSIHAKSISPFAFQ